MKRVKSVVLASLLVGQAFVGSAFAAPLSNEALEQLQKDMVKGAFDCGCPIYEAEVKVTTVDIPLGNFVVDVVTGEDTKNIETAPKEETKEKGVVDGNSVVDTLGKLNQDCLSGSCGDAFKEEEGVAKRNADEAVAVEEKVEQKEVDLTEEKDNFELMYFINGEKVVTGVLDATQAGKVGVQIMVKPNAAIEDGLGVKDQVYSSRQMNLMRNKKDFKEDWTTFFESAEDVESMKVDYADILFSDVSGKYGFDQHQSGKKKDFEFTSSDVAKKYQELTKSIEKRFVEIKSHDRIHWNYGDVVVLKDGKLENTGNVGFLQTFVIEAKEKKEQDNFKKYHVAVVLKIKDNKVADIELY